MKPFRTLDAIAAPLPLVNIDTDMIIPKQYLKTIKRTGLGKFLFDEMRHNPDGSDKPEFVLNQSAFKNAKILITGDNFGCGSSREHAPWALADYGISCIIAPGFADIFFNNCFKNSILPIILPKEVVNNLMERATAYPGSTIQVDLEKQLITAGNMAPISFDIQPFRKHCLLNGLDDIGLTLQHSAEIVDFEAKRAQAQPWA